MSDAITVGATVGMTSLAILTGVARAWPAPYIGLHRSPTATPAAQRVLDEVSLKELLADGDIETNDFAFCPAEEHTTFHAMRGNGSRRC